MGHNKNIINADQQQKQCLEYANGKYRGRGRGFVDYSINGDHTHRIQTDTLGWLYSASRTKNHLFSLFPEKNYFY
jgi:hypothetical protein